MGKGIRVLMIIAIGVIAAMVVTDYRYTSRLIDECMADGHKEWQCVALLRSNESPQMVIPVPAPYR